MQKSFYQKQAPSSTAFPQNAFPSDALSGARARVFYKGFRVEHLLVSIGLMASQSEAVRALGPLRVK